LSHRARRRLGWAGLLCLAIAAVPLAAPGPGLVPGAVDGGPGWLFGVYGEGFEIGGGAYYAWLWLAFLGYLGVVVGAAVLGRKIVWAAILVAVAAFALSAPLHSQDVFSYISYARLDAEHGLNPYLAIPADVPADAAFAQVGWQDAVSAYGPLFSIATYPLGLASVSLALWSLKAVSALSVIGLAALCARLAAERGIEPEAAAAFVALNPIVLAHVVGGAHNDALMMLLAMSGVAAVLHLADRVAGVGLVGAAAIKISAAFLGPFALFGARKKGWFMAGVVAAIALIGVVSVLAYGGHALDAVGLVGENQAKTSRYSLPSTASRGSGIDADTLRLLLGLAYAALVAWLLLWTWRGGDWLRAAGWAGLGLLLATGWLLPWYLIWVLPLAALSRDRPLVTLTLALTAFQLVNRIPV
jgi:glycosyl transferase family 87